MRTRSARAAAAIAAALLGLGVAASPAAAQVILEGCGITLLNEGATGLELAGPTGFSDSFEGDVLVIVDAPWGPGDYVATWSDGTVDTFAISCPLVPDPTPPPLPATRSKDRLVKVIDPIVAPRPAPRADPALAPAGSFLRWGRLIAR